MQVDILSYKPSESYKIIIIPFTDIAMGDSGVRRSIVQRLSSQYPGIYTNSNIAFVGTHQHAGVGGYLENLLPQIPSLGYVSETANAIISGTVLAVNRAHNSLAPGRLRYGNTTVLDANINRSPTAYLANPAEERARYLYDQDKDITVLRFDDLQGNARGFLSFFAVHGTSLYNVCLYVSMLQYSDVIFARTIHWLARTTKGWQLICTKVRPRQVSSKTRLTVDTRLQVLLSQKQCLGIEPSLPVFLKVNN
jgi:hypothetical protein